MFSTCPSLGDVLVRRQLCLELQAWWTNNHVGGLRRLLFMLQGCYPRVLLASVVAAAINEDLRFLQLREGLRKGRVPPLGEPWKHSKLSFGVQCRERLHLVKEQSSDPCIATS